MIQTPAPPAGQRGGIPHSQVAAARLFAAATTHDRSTSCAAYACAHGGNSVPGAEGRKPGLISAVPKQRSHRFGAAKGVEGAMRGRVRLSAPSTSLLETAGASVPALF